MVTLEEPRIHDVVRTPDGWAATLTFSPTASYFQGHFPALAVLPGVVQVGLAQLYAARAWTDLGPLRAVKKMKFVTPVQPHDVVRLALTRSPDGCVTYCYQKGDRTCSHGLLCF